MNCPQSEYKVFLGALALEAFDFFIIYGDFFGKAINFQKTTPPGPQLSISMEMRELFFVMYGEYLPPLPPTPFGSRCEIYSKSFESQLVSDLIVFNFI